MSYGKIEYDSEGKPICELCGKTFNNLGLHVWKDHNMKANDYKIMFGLDKKSGLLSHVTREKKSKATIANYDILIKRNLLERGKNTRFYEKNKGRTKNMLSEQTRQRLIEHINKVRKSKK